MKTIPWNKRYEIGVDFIDKEHKQLFSTINKLLNLSESEEKREWVCREGVKFLRNHTYEHFQHEETYMRSIDYSDFEIHKSLHEDFQNNTLPALEDELEATNFSEESMRHFLGVSIGWLVAHTQTEDLAIVGRKMSKWANSPESEEIDALQQVIRQIFSGMFELKPRVISRHYGGEEIGKIICLRYIYQGKDKGRWEIIMAFEEALLLKIVGDLMGEEYVKVDDMVVNITRYITRQLLEKIRENFPQMRQLELEGESLLTYEQLVATFVRENPFSSLLFDTGYGYFSFSLITSVEDREKIVSPINAHNAMGQIRKYLDGENRKKQILIVDDSDFTRSNMIRLLGDDYEMLESNSSIAAIKCIAVNRPDLILLDYEMPICDGRQTLEMIRSDEEIADIPVVFLTSRGDAESVRKVMSLKPRGYLLKTMPEAEIKKFIDAIFAKE